MTLTSAIDIQLARLRVRYAKTPLPQFFAWWSNQLVGLLPRRWRALFAEHAEELLLDAHAHELRVWRRSGERCVDFGSIALDRPAEDQRNEFMRLRDQIEDPNLRIFYCIPLQRSLRRELILPAAAEDKLRQVLTFEMDRQTPFKADQVYFDYRIAERDATGKSLKVNLNVVPRAQLDTELAALSACGVTLDGVDCWQSGSGSGRAGLNLLPQERRAKRKNQRLRLNLALGATAIVLLVIAMLQFLANRQDALDAMTGEVAKAQTEAKQTAALTKKLQDNTASANYLFRMKQDTTTMTEMLADLTKRLPDDTFLERLTVDDKGKVDVQGQSSNAAKLIEGLQKSEVLSNPGFTGTIQKDPRTGKERFNLSIETRKHPADDVPPKDGKPAEKSSGETPDKRTEAANAPSP